MRTDGDVDSPFDEEVKSGLSDEASAEQEHPEGDNVSEGQIWRGNSRLR